MWSEYPTLCTPSLWPQGLLQKKRNPLILWSNSSFDRFWRAGGGLGHGQAGSVSPENNLILINKSGRLRERGNKANLMTCSWSKRSDIYFWFNIKEYLFPHRTFSGLQLQRWVVVFVSMISVVEHILTKGSIKVGASGLGSSSNFGVILSDMTASEKSPRHTQILIEGAQWIPR